jgi:hypothetical protein
VFWGWDLGMRRGGGTGHSCRACGLTDASQHPIYTPCPATPPAPPPPNRRFIAIAINSSRKSPAPPPAPYTHTNTPFSRSRFPRPVHHRIPNFVDAEKASPGAGVGGGGGWRSGCGNGIVGRCRGGGLSPLDRLPPFTHVVRRQTPTLSGVFYSILLYHIP